MRKMMHDTATPCWFMKTWVSRLADGSLGGLPLWYARLHVPRCARCRAAYEELRALLLRLRRIDEPPPAASGSPALSPDRWAAVEAAWERLDRGDTGPPPPH
jgi:hypothetical protein